MSQLYSKDLLERNRFPGRTGKDGSLWIIRELKQCWQWIWQKIFFLWIQIEAPGPQGSTVPWMLCLQEAVQRQHTYPLWQKRCGLFSKERGRWAEIVDRVRTVVGRAVKMGKHEREKKSESPGSERFRDYHPCQHHCGICLKPQITTRSKCLDFCLSSALKSIWTGWLWERTEEWETFSFLLLLDFLFSSRAGRVKDKDISDLGV